MDPEEVLNLFDSYWFHQLIFVEKPIIPHTQEPETHKQPENPPISRISSLHVRSLSDQFSAATSFCSDYLSPKSVLSSHHKLQPILSGKEVTEEIMTPDKDYEKKEDHRHGHHQKIEINQRRKKKGRTKSLSDLEFEELKGFIDLGFIFSEEDKNSSLVSIIPGLQKLGKGTDQQEEDEDDEEEEDQRGGMISRPYLSEAWGVIDRRKEPIRRPLIDWKVPALGSEIDMKDNLRHWAHTVASTVR